MKAKDLRAVAREKLKDNWGTAVLTTLVAGVLGGATVTSSSVSSRVDTEKTTERLQSVGIEDINTFLQSVPDWVWVTLGIVTSVMMIWGIATTVLGGVTRIGFSRYTLNVLDGNGKFGDIFSYYNTLFLKGFITRILITLFTFLWTLLFIIPGIIASYKYSMTYFILAENPDLDVMEAISASKEMMKGNKWRLFCLQVSFIGWMILCAFTAGIGTLFLNPYMEVSTAAFYNEIKAQKQVL